MAAQHWERTDYFWVQFKMFKMLGAWVAQLVKLSAQVMISQFREFETRVRLHADGAEPAWDSLSLPLSLSPILSTPPPFMLCLSLSK